MYKGLVFICLVKFRNNIVGFGVVVNVILYFKLVEMSFMKEFWLSVVEFNF